MVEQHLVGFLALAGPGADLHLLPGSRLGRAGLDAADGGGRLQKRGVLQEVASAPGDEVLDPGYRSPASRVIAIDSLLVGLGRVELGGVPGDFIAEHGTVVLYHGANYLPVEGFIENRFHMGEVARLQVGRREQLADQGAFPGVFKLKGALGELSTFAAGFLRRGSGGTALIGAPGIVSAESWRASEGAGRSSASGIAGAPAPPATAPTASTATAMEAEGLVAVVGHEVDAAAGVLVHDEITSTAEVAVAIHEQVVDGDEPEGAVDVEHLSDDFFDLVGGSFIKESAELDDVIPGGFRSLGCFQMNVGLVVVEVLAEIAQPRCALGIGGNLPADAFLGVIPVSQEVLVVLLDVEVDPPAGPVDDQLDVIRLRGRQVLAGDVVVENMAQERRVGVAVQEVEGLVAVEPLVVAVFHSNVEGALLAGGDSEEG